MVLCFLLVLYGANSWGGAGERLHLESTRFYAPEPISTTQQDPRRHQDVVRRPRSRRLRQLRRESLTRCFFMREGGELHRLLHRQSRASASGKRLRVYCFEKEQADQKQETYKMSERTGYKREEWRKHAMRRRRSPQFFPVAASVLSSVKDR
jgi:hypothetical protein